MVYEPHDPQQSRERLLRMYCMSRQQQGLSIPADLCSTLATRLSLQAPTTSSTRSYSNGDSFALDGPGSGRDPCGSGQGKRQHQRNAVQGPWTSTGVRGRTPAILGRIPSAGPATEATLQELLKPMLTDNGSTAPYATFGCCTRHGRDHRRTRQQFSMRRRSPRC